MKYIAIYVFCAFLFLESCKNDLPKRNNQESEVVDFIEDVEVQNQQKSKCFISKNREVIWTLISDTAVKVTKLDSNGVFTSINDLKLDTKNKLKFANSTISFEQSETGLKSNSKSGLVVYKPTKMYKGRLNHLVKMDQFLSINEDQTFGIYGGQRKGITGTILKKNDLIDLEITAPFREKLTFKMDGEDFIQCSFDGKTFLTPEVRFKLFQQ